MKYWCAADALVFIGIVCELFVGSLGQIPAVHRYENSELSRLPIRG